MKRTLLAVWLLAAPLCGGMFSAAGEQDAGRGVARISVMNGDVSVRRADSGDWVAAAVNGPLVVPDSVYTGTGSRAEIQLDYANLVRLAPGTEVKFTELDYRKYQLEIARGTITFSVLKGSDSQTDLSTPNVSVRPLKRGRYRVTVREDGTTEITVRRGKAEIYTPRGVETLKSGKTMLVRGEASSPEFQMVAAIAKDKFDRWNQARDKELERSNAYRYVSSDIDGARALDGYGEWVYDPLYGWVWSPRVAAGWAPYRYGRWSWLDWYGWSWISYDPWGWAPYHYGRWFYNRPYGWCWWPGSVYGHYRWRPALVAFFGWDSYSGFHAGVGVGFGFGRIGWVPLAPYERYRPWYGRGWYRGYRNSTYIDNSVNIVNNVNVTNIYRNARLRNAITAVDGRRFGRGGVHNVYRASDDAVRRASLIRGQLPVAPARVSLRMSNRQPRSNAIPAWNNRTRFYTRRSVHHLERVPFAEQQRAIERTAQRVFSASRSPRVVASRGSGGRAASPARRGAATVVNAEPATRGWRRASGASSASRSGPVTVLSPRASRSAAGARSSRAHEGWRRFGEPIVGQRTPAGVPGSFRSRSPAPAAPAADRGSNASRWRTVPSRSSGWRRFGEPARTSRSIPSVRAPASTIRGATPPSGRSVRGSSPANRRSGSSTGWRHFEPQRTIQPRDGQPRYSDRARGRRTTGRDRYYGGTRIPSRSGWFGSGRRSYERSAPTRSLEVRPPVVRRRSSPRSFGSPRTNRGMAPRSYGRPSGSIFGGRSSRPAPGNRSFGGWHSSRGIFGGGSRPSIGSRSMGRGGGISRSSAPVNRGYRGSSRGASRSGGRRR